MKELLSLKRFDFWIQVVAMIFPILIGVIYHNVQTIFAVYITLGGVQVLSCLLNRIFLKSDYRVYARGWYEIVLLILALFGLIALLIVNQEASTKDASLVVNHDFVIVYMFLMLFAGVAMGVWYLIISMMEVEYIAKLVKRHELIK